MRRCGSGGGLLYIYGSSLLWRRVRLVFSDAGEAALGGGRSGGSPASPVAEVLVVFYGRVGGMLDGVWSSWRGPARALFLAQILIWRLCCNHGVPYPSRWRVASVTLVDG